MKNIILILVYICIPLHALCQDLKIIDHRCDNVEDLLIYKSDTLYAFVNKTDTTFISDDVVLMDFQRILREQNQCLGNFGINVLYPEIIADEIERIAILLENISSLNYKQNVKDNIKTLTFYGPICLMLRRSHQVAIKKCVLVIENDRLIKNVCSYYKRKDLCFPSSDTKYEYEYDEKSRIKKISNKGVVNQTIYYIQ